MLIVVVHFFQQTFLRFVVVAFVFFVICYFCRVPTCACQMPSMVYTGACAPSNGLTINLNLSPSTVFFFGKKEFYDSLEFIGFSIPFARKTGSFQLQWVVVYPITGNNRIPVFQKTKTHQCACARSTIKIRFATVSASRNGEFSRLWELLEADREKKLWGIPH